MQKLKGIVYISQLGHFHAVSSCCIWFHHVVNYFTYFSLLYTDSWFPSDVYSKYIKVVTFVYLNSDEAHMNTHHYLWIFGVPGFHGDLVEHRRYSGHMGCSCVTRCLLLRFRIYIILFLKPRANTINQIKSKLRGCTDFFHLKYQSLLLNTPM